VAKKAMKEKEKKLKQAKMEKAKEL